MTSTIKHTAGIKIFSCGSNQKLAEEIASSLGVKLASSEVGQFSDGETYVHVNEIVRGIDCFIVQPMSSPVNNSLMELLIMIDALRRASAGRITAVMPYYGYARQDRKTRARDPISARLVADLIQTAGADRVVAMDLHCSQIQGFFTIPVDHMLGNPLLIKYYKDKFKDDKDIVVVSPDIGSVKRSRSFAERIDAPLAIIDKRRPEHNVSEVMNIIGDGVSGKKVIMVDDMIDTAGTICNAANALKEHGAAEVYACCTHAVLSGPAIERIEKSSINELVVLDTIALPKEKQIDKIKQLSVANILAEAIYRINANKSVSKLFN